MPEKILHHFARDLFSHKFINLNQVCVSLVFFKAAKQNCCCFFANVWTGSRLLAMEAHKNARRAVSYDTKFGYVFSITGSVSGRYGGVITLANARM